MNSRFTPTLVVFIALVIPAHAGIELSNRVEGPAGHRQAGRVRVQGQAARIDLTAPPSGEGDTSILFDATTSTMRVLRHRDKTYIELDKDQIATIARAIASVRQQLKNRLAQIPPEQRAALEKMLAAGPLAQANPGESAPLAQANPGESAQPVAVKITPTDETDSIGGIPCRIHKMHRAQVALGQSCVARWEDLSIRKKDLEPLMALARFQLKMTQSLAGPVPGASQGLELMTRIDGFALRAKNEPPGQPPTITYFEKLTRIELQENIFSVPSDYRRQEFAPPPNP